MPILHYKPTLLESYQKERLLRWMKGEIYAIWAYPWFDTAYGDATWLLYIFPITIPIDPESDVALFITWAENNPESPDIIIQELILNERSRVSFLKKGSSHSPSLTFIIRTNLDKVSEAKKSQVLNFLNYITGELGYKKAKYFIDSGL